MVFTTPKGLYHFIKMHFVLHRVAAFFQRMMDKALAPVCHWLVVYIDVILIFSPNWESHIQHLRRSMMWDWLQIKRKTIWGSGPSSTLALYSRPFMGWGHIGPLTVRRLCHLIQNESWSFFRTDKNYCCFVPHFNTLTVPLMDLMQGKDKGLAIDSLGRWPFAPFLY